MRVRRDITSFRLVFVKGDHRSEGVSHPHSSVESPWQEFVLGEVTSLLRKLSYWGLKVELLWVHRLRLPVLFERWLLMEHTAGESIIHLLSRVSNLWVVKNIRSSRLFPFKRSNLWLRGSTCSKLTLSFPLFDFRNLLFGFKRPLFLHWKLFFGLSNHELQVLFGSSSLLSLIWINGFLSAVAN